MPTNEMRIVIIGKAGAGKSTLGNTILGKDEFLVECSPAAVTTETQVGLGERASKKLVIVDTPGLYDPTQPNEDILKEIMKCYALTSPGLHAILFVIEIGKFTPEEKATVDLFLEKFGENIRNYMVVVFTGKEKLGKDSIEDFIQKFPSDSGMQILLQQIKNRYICLGKNKDQEDIDRLLNVIEAMVQSNGGRFYTNAMYEQTEKFLQNRQNQEERHEKVIQTYEKEIENHNAMIDELLRKLRKQESDEREIERLILENEECQKKLKGEIAHKSSRNEQRRDITSNDFISSVLGVLFNQVINY